MRDGEEAPNLLLPPEGLPDGFEYPEAFLRMVDENVLSLSPWSILTRDVLVAKTKSMRLRYPERSLVPFAIRQDNDDVACWDPLHSSGVVIVHDFASPGWELQGEFPDFRSWLQAALDELLEWISD